MINDQYVQTGTVLSWKEIGAEVEVSRATVARHVAALKRVEIIRLSRGLIP